MVAVRMSAGGDIRGIDGERWNVVVPSRFQCPFRSRRNRECIRSVPQIESVGRIFSTNGTLICRECFVFTVLPQVTLGSALRSVREYRRQS